MKIKFLGTAAAEGIPGMFCECERCEKARRLSGKNIRTRSQSLINDDLLIDFPADTYMHILRDGLKLHNIYHCIITHAHPDHLYPEDFHMRRAGFATLKDAVPFTIYGTNYVIEKIRQTGIKDDDRMVLKEIKAFNPFSAADYYITPLEADHSSVEEPIIYLIQKDGKTILYAHDTGYFPNNTWEWLEKSNVHIDFATFDCCFGLEKYSSSHMGFDTVCEVRDRLKKIGAADEKTICCINHFSHNVAPLHNELENHAKKFDILTSYDGMEAEF